MLYIPLTSLLKFDLRSLFIFLYHDILVQKVLLKAVCYKRQHSINDTYFELYVTGISWGLGGGGYNTIISSDITIVKPSHSLIQSIKSSNCYHMYIYFLFPITEQNSIPFSSPLPPFFSTPTKGFPLSCLAFFPYNSHTPRFPLIYKSTTPSCFSLSLSCPTTC